VRAEAVVEAERTAGSVHDSDGFQPTTWQRDALYIWDLGYNSYGRFIDALRGGAHVLQRLKEGANPTVLASYGPDGHRRAVRSDDGKPLSLDDACNFGHVHKQRVLDLDVELRDGGRKVTARVVCVPFDGEDRYYLTTLPREIFSPHDAAELYRIRWEVELFFRNWKGGVRLDQVRRLSHPESLDVAITASMLAALLARDVTTHLNELAAEIHAAEAVAIPP
jgi:IS4 transposase